MKASTMNIYINGLRLHARHGVDIQEQEVGSDFLLDLSLTTDFSTAAHTDNLKDTINYADVYKKIKEEMAIPSKLLEHVCERICKRLFLDFPTIDEICIRLTKVNPPMGAECKECGVSVRYVR